MLNHSCQWYLNITTYENRGKYAVFFPRVGKIILEPMNKHWNVHSPDFLNAIRKKTILESWLQSIYHFFLRRFKRSKTRISFSRSLVILLTTKWKIQFLRKKNPTNNCLLKGAQRGDILFAYFQATFQSVLKCLNWHFNCIDPSLATARKQNKKSDRD